MESVSSAAMSDHQTESGKKGRTEDESLSLKLKTDSNEKDNNDSGGDGYGRDKCLCRGVPLLGNSQQD